MPSLLFARLSAILLAMAAAGVAAASGHSTGQDLYLQHCADCHGAKLQGQPDWRSPDEAGLFPAPPHDETGHTWHHPDAMLIDYVTRGGQQVLDDLGVAFTSGMPAFGSVLTEAEIVAILDYIKSTWPEHIRKQQSLRTNGRPVD